MRSILTAGLAALGCAATIACASAADWTPPGPIKMIVAFTAGGGADTQGRLLADGLEARTGWRIIPENVAGNGGLNAMMQLMKAPKDGTVIVMASTDIVGYGSAAAGLNWKASDVTPLLTTASFQMAFVGAKAKGWKTFDDAIAVAKKGQNVRFGVLSQKQEDVAYLLAEAQGIKLNIVPFKGGKRVMDALIGGDIDVGFVAGAQAKAVAAGDLVELASALSVPLRQTPQAPVIASYGISYNLDGYFAVFGPSKMPNAAREAIVKAAQAVIDDPNSKLSGFLKNAFGGPSVISGEKFEAFVRQNVDDAQEILAAVAKK